MQMTTPFYSRRPEALHLWPPGNKHLGGYTNTSYIICLHIGFFEVSPFVATRDAPSHVDVNEPFSFAFFIQSERDSLEVASQDVYIFIL